MPGLLGLGCARNDPARKGDTPRLDALRAKIRERRDAAVDATPENTEVWLPLASLIAYHDLVERAPEWPFDAPMLARLALVIAMLTFASSWANRRVA